MPTYGSLVTNAGDALVAAAISGGAPVELSTIVIGDANGDDVLPDANQTDLINEVYVVSIATLSVDSDNPNQILATAIIPAEVGGWDIRELGVKTLDGTLFAVSNFSPARKPIAAEGSVWVMELTVAIAVASTSAITLVVDPDIDYATKQWVIDNFEPLGSGGVWVPITRIISAGPGLAGGGNLSQDREFHADKPWFDARYSPLGHLHDDRYSLLGHGHANVVASGAAGFMTGADKTKLDGLGAAGMRLLAEASGSTVDYIDLTLAGPFSAIAWQVDWDPLYNDPPTDNEPTSCSAIIQTTNGSFPARSGAYPSNYPIQLGMNIDTGGIIDGLTGHVAGAGILFSNGLSLRHRSDYTPVFPSQRFAAATVGQNRYMRVVVQYPAAGPSFTAVPFTGSIKVWGF